MPVVRKANDGTPRSGAAVDGGMDRHRRDAVSRLHHPAASRRSLRLRLFDVGHR